MLIDAFVVRMTLVPAVLTLLGDRAWAFPRWLDRITPNVDIEGESLRVAQEARAERTRHRRLDSERGTDRIGAPLGSGWQI